MTTVAQRGAARTRQRPALSVDELIIFLNDRDLAFKALRDMRIPFSDPRRPARVEIARVRSWLARRRQA